MSKIIKTLDDLRTMIQENTVVRKLDKDERLTRKKLVEGNCPVIFKTTINDRTLTIYSDGYILYEQQKYYTIFTVDQIQFRYDFVNTEKFIVPESEYCNDVVLALSMFGETRLAKNSYARAVMPHEEELKYQEHNPYASTQDFVDEMIAQYEKKNIVRELHKAINKLTKNQQEAILLYYFNNCTQDKTASILNIDRSSVRSRLYNGKNSLKEALKKYYY